MYSLLVETQTLSPISRFSIHTYLYKLVVEVYLSTQHLFFFLSKISPLPPTFSIDNLTPIDPILPQNLRRL